jgi:dTDP-4-dehydrorhamnose 3,5-epimerase
VSKFLLTPLARIDVSGGDVLHAIKIGDRGYDNFGEAYFSWINPKVVKAWKRHLQMTMNLIVPVGNVKFVFCTESEGKFTVDRVQCIGESNYVRVTVEPGVWFGFQGISDAPSLILNVSNIPHDPQEVERLDLDRIDYEWSKR